MIEDIFCANCGGFLFETYPSNGVTCQCADLAAAEPTHFSLTEKGRYHGYLLVELGLEDRHAEDAVDAGPVDHEWDELGEAGA